MGRAVDETEVLAGGTCDDGEGWFVRPTVVLPTDAGSRYFTQEFFGPLLAVWVYEDTAWPDTLELVERSAPYALTGAIFATERSAILQASQQLRFTAGNFYVNDKPTGAVVGQQPFGGGRASGTNDKAGSLWNLIRWLSPRSVKETFVPPTRHLYPSME